MRFLNRKTGWFLAGLALLGAAILLAGRIGWLPLDHPAGIPFPRQPGVLYLSPVDAPELWRVGVDGKAPIKLTETGGKVYDYAASPDGSHITYSAGNAQNGRDVWEIDREGGKPRILLPCGTDWCQTPAYSPDGARIAYSRRQYDGLGGEPGMPRLWVIDRNTLFTEVISPDANLSGSDPAWSPDGGYLAFADPQSGGVRVLDLKGKSTFLVPAEAGAAAVWSPDSQKLLVIRVEGALVEGVSAPGLAVAVVDARTRQVSSLAGASEPAVEYSLPDWSPDGQWLALAERPFAGSGGKQLWVARADGSQREAISDDPLVNDASYHWSPDGTKLVFQRLVLGASNSLPKIMLWDRKSEALIEIAKEGFQPHWIP